MGGVPGPIRLLIEQGVALEQRSLVVVVGGRGREQVAKLHDILSRSRGVRSARPSVLWCYKKELEFRQAKKKRLQNVRKAAARRLNVTTDSPLDLFISQTSIRWCLYRDTVKILGSTFGFLVLQDFEALTPNILARTIETIEGGGIVVLLLERMTSIEQLYMLTMDVHSKFRQPEVVPRFNERFVLSLADCDRCVFVDDNLAVLPMSSKLPTNIEEEEEETATAPPSQQEGVEIKSITRSLEQDSPARDLVAKARTVDQARALLALIQVVTENRSGSIAALTAPRGRGKSATLGLCLSAAIRLGYANIFVTAPTPENLKTVFEFAIAGLRALGYEEHADFEVSNASDRTPVGITVRGSSISRQTVRYVSPTSTLSYAQVVLVDEAAALPIPVVRALIGPYIVLLASTVTGYEGTGRALQLKLINQLRETKHSPSELTLDTPIRYAREDAVELWLHKALCLESPAFSLMHGMPPPASCELYHVDRDTLFSYHPLCESLLQRIMALYTSAHYKNTPNDLQMLSDAPMHRLFVLLGPRDAQQVPDVLVVIQVAFEGAIAKVSVEEALASGERAAGDLIPWTLAQQFCNSDFPRLSGVRIVRISTHPEVQSMGYGTRALELLIRFFEQVRGKESHGKQNFPIERSLDSKDPNPAGSLRPRKSLPPLFAPLEQMQMPQLDWIGTSFGLTPQLFNFWARLSFRPVYVRQTPSDLTGEHTIILLREVAESPSRGWLDSMVSDARSRFGRLLAACFGNLDIALCVGILGAVDSKGADDSSAHKSSLTKRDMVRLEHFVSNTGDYRTILDLIPLVAELVFFHKINGAKLSALQTALLLGIGLQRRDLNEVSESLNLTPMHGMALFVKTLRKLVLRLRELSESEN